MKKILFILGLLISANVYAQPKQIYVGGDVLTVSGDTLYKNGVFLAELGGTAIDTTGQFVTAVEALNDTVGRAKKGGTWTNFNMKGRNYTAENGLTKTGNTFKLGGIITEETMLSGVDNGIRFWKSETGAGIGKMGTSTSLGTGVSMEYSSLNSGLDSYVGVTEDLVYINSGGNNLLLDTSTLYGLYFHNNSYDGYAFPINSPTPGQVLKYSGTTVSTFYNPFTPLLEWANESGGGGSNFPTINDTLPDSRELYQGIHPLLFSSASGNAFTLSNTGLSYDIGGNNAILMNSSYNEFKTGNISTYGMLKTTNNTARLYATDGTNTSTVVAHPKYVELDGKDSTVIKNIDEVAIDTATQHVAVLQGNQLKKVKWQTLKADSTLTITGDSISVNLPKALGYREYVASLTQVGTDAPVATVLFNNLGDSVVWVYSGVGEYTAQYYNGGSSLDVLSDYASITNNVWYEGKIFTVNVQTGANTVVYTKDSGTLKDDLLGGISAGGIEHIITIRVYE